MTAGLYTISSAAIVGAVLMVLTGCLPVRRVYEQIDWKVIVLLAGLLPLGMALETSGAAGQAVGWLIGVTGDWGPAAVLGLFFLLTSLLTGFMSNTATAALLAPLAITCAAEPGCQSATLPGRRDLRGVGGVLHADRLPDQPAGLRSGRLPLCRFRPGRRAAHADLRALSPRCSSPVFFPF